jgi:hypothetical protein
MTSSSISILSMRATFRRFMPLPALRVLNCKIFFLFTFPPSSFPSYFSFYAGRR